MESNVAQQALCASPDITQLPGLSFQYQVFNNKICVQERIFFSNKEFIFSDSLRKKEIVYHTIFPVSLAYDRYLIWHTKKKVLNFKLRLRIKKNN